jgi:hypothetical protein
MSNLGITLIIVLVLGIIGGNILLLKKSARFEIKKEIKTEIKKKTKDDVKKEQNKDEDEDDSSW